MENKHAICLGELFWDHQQRMNEQEDTPGF